MIPSIKNERGDALIMVLLAMAVGFFVAEALMTISDMSIKTHYARTKERVLESSFLEISTQLNHDVNLCDPDSGYITLGTVTSAGEYPVKINLNSRSESSSSKYTLASSKFKGSSDQTTLDGWDIVDMSIKDILATSAVDAYAGTPMGIGVPRPATLQISFNRPGSHGGILHNKSFPMYVIFNESNVLTQCYSISGHSKLEQNKREIRTLVSEIKNRFNQLWTDSTRTQKVNLCDANTGFLDASAEMVAGTPNLARVRVKLNRLASDGSGSTVVLSDPSRLQAGEMTTGLDKVGVSAGWTIEELSIELPIIPTDLSKPVRANLILVASKYKPPCTQMSASCKPYVTVNANRKDENFKFPILIDLSTLPLRVKKCYSNNHQVIADYAEAWCVKLGGKMEIIPPAETRRCVKQI